METLSAVATDETPKAEFDSATGVLVLEGRSFPENVASFYDPIMEWLYSYRQSPQPKTVFNMRLSYFNTASSKILLDILMLLEEIQQDDNEVTVNWYYNPDDEDMLDAGEEYSEIVEDLHFEFHEEEEV